MAAKKRNTAPALFRKGPSLLMRIQYKENGVRVRAAFKVGNVSDPIEKAHRNAKVVRELVKSGRVDEVAAFLEGKLSVDVHEGHTISVNEIAEELFEREEIENPRNAKEWRSVYRNHVKNRIGRLPIKSVSPAVVREKVFEPMADKGLAPASLNNVRIVARRVFAFGLYKELIDRNPVDAIYKMPRAKRDVRTFVLPTDDEFVLLIAYIFSRPFDENVDGVAALELGTLIVCSRFLGGQRTSDLHAWEWSDIDLQERKCWVRRPKTENSRGRISHGVQRTQHIIGDDEHHVLSKWWEYEGKPTKGPVFPTRIGKRAGLTKKGTGYAASLRTAMRRALGIEVPEVQAEVTVRKYKDGSTRKMPFEKTRWVQARKPKGREITLLHGDADFRSLNMHTMRRAFASGLAMAGWSRAQMKTAGGWRTDAMPARYDLSAQHALVDAAGTTPRLRLVPPLGGSHPPTKEATQEATNVPNGADLENETG